MGLEVDEGVKVGLVIAIVEGVGELNLGRYEKNGGSFREDIN